MTAPNPAAIRSNAGVFAAELERVAQVDGRDAALLEAAAMLQAAYLTLSTLSDPGHLACELARFASEVGAPPFMGWATAANVTAPSADQIDEESHVYARALRLVKGSQGRHVAVERASGAILASGRAIAQLVDASTAALTLQSYAARAAYLASAAAAHPDRSTLH